MDDYNAQIASGKMLDKRYLDRRRPNKRWSQLNFPNENPLHKDFTLGWFNHDRYKLWPWRHDHDSQRLLHCTTDGMDVYRKLEDSRTRSTMRWELSEIG